MSALVFTVTLNKPEEMCPTDICQAGQNCDGSMVYTPGYIVPVVVVVVVVLVVVVVEHASMLPVLSSRLFVAGNAPQSAPLQVQKSTPLTVADSVVVIMLTIIESVYRAVYAPTTPGDSHCMPVFWFALCPSIWNTCCTKLPTETMWSNAMSYDRVHSATSSMVRLVWVHTPSNIKSIVFPASGSTHISRPASYDGAAVSATTPWGISSHPEQALEQLIDRCRTVAPDATFMYVNSMVVSDDTAYTWSNSSSHQITAPSC